MQPKKKNQNAEVPIPQTKKKCQNADVHVAATEKKHRNADPEVDNKAEVKEQTDRPLKRLRLRYQEKHVSITSGCSNPRLVVNSKHLQLQKVDNPLALLIPKDEPATDDVLPLEFSIPAVYQVPLCKEQFLGGKDSVSEAEVTLSCHSVNAEESSSPSGSSCENRTNCESANIIDESASKLEIASTASGKVKISMSCIPQGSPDFCVPNLDELFKRTEDKCLRSYKFLDPSFSVRKMLNELCECALELGTPSKESKEATNVPSADVILRKSTAAVVTKESRAPARSVSTPDAARVGDSELLFVPPTSNGIGQIPQPVNGFTGKRSVDKDNERNNMENANSYGLMVVKHLEMMPFEIKPRVNIVNDISKGLESVLISLVNEVSNDPPPAFHYLPGNIKFEKADVSFSLAWIGDNFCSTCIGDCASNSCACACATGGAVYTCDGLIKEDFLEECILVNRDSRKQSFSYCKDCPLERSKPEETKEGCKGHLVRKFINECWWKCGCNGRCGNRVVQRGIKRRLQVFMTPKGKGWGLRTLEDLPKGTFVCEFAGEILTNKELYTRMSESSGKHDFPVLLDADWSAMVMKDEEALCLDEVFYGNVARFINHQWIPRASLLSFCFLHSEKCGCFGGTHSGIWY